MSRSYNIVDSDGHVLEPPDFWENYIDPKFRGRTPELIVDTDGKEHIREGMSGVMPVIYHQGP